MSVWEAGWPADWRDNLMLVIPDQGTLLRDATLLIVPPLTALRRPVRRAPIIFAILFVALVANPWAGPAWLALLKPGSYWRLVYLLPLAWSAGLALSVLASHSSRRNWARATFAAGVIALVVLTVKSTSLACGGPLPLVWSFARGDKLDPVPAESCRRHCGELAGRSVLAPEEIVAVLALLDPTIRFEATRTVETQHLFLNAGEPAEGERRVLAQRAVTELSNGLAVRAAVESLHGAVDAAIVATESEPALLRVLARPGSEWRFVSHGINGSRCTFGWRPRRANSNNRRLQLTA